MSYRKMRRNIIVTIMACLVLLVGLSWKSCFAQDVIPMRGVGEEEISGKKAIPLNAIAIPSVSGSVTFSWKSYRKAATQPATYSYLQNNTVSSLETKSVSERVTESIHMDNGTVEQKEVAKNSYTVPVSLLNDPTIGFYCEMSDTNGLLGVVYWEFTIAEQVTEPQDNPDLSQGYGSPVPSTGQPVNGSFSPQDDQPVNITKVPAAVKVKPAKRGKISVSWKKLKKTKKTKALLGKIKSVQIQYSTDPGFQQDVHSKTIRKNKTKADLKLQKNTIYFVRVRYVGSTGVSNWSATRRVRAR